MDELLVTWLSSDNVFENVLKLIETYRSSSHNHNHNHSHNHGTPNKSKSPPSSPSRKGKGKGGSSHSPEEDSSSSSAPRGHGIATIPPFYRPPGTISNGIKAKPIRKRSFDSDQSWDGLYTNHSANNISNSTSNSNSTNVNDSTAAPSSDHSTTSNPSPSPKPKPIKDQVALIFQESGKQSSDGLSTFLTMDNFVKITKEICSLPTFFNGPLYIRILYLYNTHTLSSPSQKQIIWKEFQKDGVRIGVDPDTPLEDGADENELLEHLDTVITQDIFKWYWEEEMEDYDASERFFRLIKKPSENHIAQE